MNSISIKKAALWLTVLVFGFYIWSVEAPFHFDDTHSVESNLALRSLSNIPSYWTDNRTSSFIPENRVYRPLVYTFYSFCWLVGGGKTWPFHLMKMGMQVLVALAVFLIWRRLWQVPGWLPVSRGGNGLKIKIPFLSPTYEVTPDLAALLLASIFAIHPAGTECVIYISSTTSLQAAMFYVWAFQQFLSFRDTRQTRSLVLSLVLYFLAVASKEEGITLVAMVAITEFMLTTGPFKQRLNSTVKRSVPYAALFGVLAFWQYSMLPREGLESHGWATPWEYFMTQWRAYLWYMRLWFWPWELNADSATIVYSKSITEPLVIQALIGNVLVLAIAWLNRQRFPALLFGVLWFYITISPASSIVVLAEAINERRMYLAYVGFIGGTFAAILHIADKAMDVSTRARRLGVAYALILVGLGIGTYNRNFVWLTSENLWADTVEKNPTSGRALNNLALVHLGRGEFEKSIGLLDQCERHWSTYMYCSLNKGIAYQSMKKFDDAEKSYLRSYQLNPRNVHLNFHIGRFYQDVRKDNVKAIVHYGAAVDLTGGRYPAADINMANALSELKRFDEARKSLNRALEVEPDNGLARFQLARLEADQGRHDIAVEAYEKLLAKEPEHLQGWYNYGVSSLALGRLDDARKGFERTVGIDPKSEQGWYNLAFVAEKLKDGAKALSAARQLATLYPQNQTFVSRVKELERKFGGSVPN